jgi:hypothetical protein
MGEASDLGPSVESAQDLAKMIPLQLVGPWSYIRTYRVCRLRCLPIESWQSIGLNKRKVNVEAGEREMLDGKGPFMGALSRGRAFGRWARRERGSKANEDTNPANTQLPETELKVPKSGIAGQRELWMVSPYRVPIPHKQSR